MSEAARTVLTGALVSSSVRAYFETMPKGPMYLEEAEFGLRHILPVLSGLPDGARVLEVGSGPCILLAEITERFPHLAVHGIEPMAAGFAFFDDFVGRMRAARSGINLHLGGYEDFSEVERFDFNFLVNVFEHLPDWRHFLGFVSRSLSPGGRCLMMSPNYGFPYESHFRLPVVGNKRLTGAIFRKAIDRFERENDYIGLYSSLNFVRLAQVRRAAPAHGLEIDVNTGIVRDMIERLDRDRAFEKRQGSLALPAQFLKKSGLLDFLLSTRIAQDYLPYMQIIFRRGG